MAKSRLMKKPRPAGMKRRLLSMVMALTLIVGLLPTSAFATNSWQLGEYNGYDAQTGTRNGNSYENETDATQTLENDGITMQKNITAAGTENLFNIELIVTTEEQLQEIPMSPDAAVVLVIDASSSMNYNDKGCGYICLVSGHKDRFHSGTGYYGAWWPAEETRMPKAKAAAVKFVDNFVTNAGDARRMISVVSFNGKANTVIGWTESNTALNPVGTQKNDIDDVKTAINSIQTDSSTNIEAGLQNAYDLLGNNAIQGIKSKYVILLTDGAPTDSNQYGSHSIKDFAEDAANMARNIRINRQATLYTLAYAVANETLYGNVTVGKWLENDIASDGCAYNATTGDEISISLTDIIETISKLMQAWQVNDPMGAYMKTPTITSKKGQDVVSVDSNGTILWNLWLDTPTQSSSSPKTYTYKLSYQVELDTAKQGFAEETFYETNQPTTLKYAVDLLNEDGTLNVNASIKTAYFNIPTVQGTIPNMGYTIEYYKWDKETQRYPDNPTDQTNGTAKLWSNVNAPDGYADKYSYSNYYWVEGDTSMTLTPTGENVLRLYYKPLVADVTVNHYYTTTENYYEDGELKSQIIENQVLRNPVTSSAYVGDSFTAVEVTEASDGKGNYTLTNPQAKTIRVNSDETKNVINLYYERSYTVGDTTSVTVNHNWTLNTYTVVDGTLHKNTTTGNKDPLTVNGQYVGNSYTAHQNQILIDEGFVNSGDCSQTIVLSEGSNVINFNYTKDVYPATATATVKYEYITKTVSYDAEGKEQISQSSVWGDPATITGYDEEIKTPDDHPQYAGNTYTRVTDEFTITLDKNNPGEYIIQYERTVYPENATVTVTHTYTHYVWQTETDDEGNITGGQWVLASEQPESHVVTPEGTFYAGQHYIVSEDKNGNTAYTYVSGDKGEQALHAGKNSYLLSYEWYDKAEDDMADVTVYHNYYQKVSYIDADGQVAERVDTVAEAVTDTSADYFEGLKGTSFTAVENTSYDGKAYDRTAPDSLSGILQSRGATMDIDYMAKDVRDEKVAATVTVTHTYKTYTTYVDANGNLVKDALSTITGDTEHFTNLYVGQSFTASPKTIPVISGTATDDEKGTYTTVTTTLTVDPLSETNQIDIVYERYVDDGLTTTNVIVKHVYQTLVKEVVDGVYQEFLRNDTDKNHEHTYSDGLYVGMKFTAVPDSLEGTEYVRQTVDSDLTLFPLAESGNEITISYLATMPDVGDAQYKVVHKYNSYDYLGNLIEDPAYTYETETDLYTVVNGNGVNITVNEVAVADYKNEGTASQTKTLNMDEVTVFTFIYSRTIINPTDVTVIHNYYKDADALANGESVEGSYQETVSEVDGEALKENGSYTAVLRTENNALPYTFNSADPEGYTIASLASKGENTITINYVRAETTYTVNHVYRTNGSETGTYQTGGTGKVNDVINAADITKEPVYEGNTYNYTSASAESMTLVLDPAANTITLYYDRTTGGGGTTTYYNVTVNYYDLASGDEIAPSHSQRIRSGSSYDVSAYDAIAIEGYTYDSTSGDALSGTMNGDKVIDVWYTADGSDIEDPDVPTGELPDDGTDIEDPDVPTGELPDDGTDLEDPDVPMGELPDDVTDLEDPDVPLAEVPATGDTLMAWVAAAAVSGIGLVWLAISGKKRKDETN